VAEARKGQQRGAPDNLRAAIERTFAATAEGAAGTRERAGEMLDEAVRRGRGAIEGMRLASREDVRELTEQIERLSRRVEKLERKVKVKG
jgi:polyhydroxyalkanoate synthesis regulator phasin